MIESITRGRDRDECADDHIDIGSGLTAANRIPRPANPLGRCGCTLDLRICNGEVRSNGCMYLPMGEGGVMVLFPSGKRKSEKVVQVRREGRCHRPASHGARAPGKRKNQHWGTMWPRGTRNCFDATIRIPGASQP